MVYLRRGVFKTSANVGLFQELIIGENFGHAGAAGEHVERVFDSQPVVPDAGAPAALVRVKVMR